MIKMWQLILGAVGVFYLGSLAERNKAKIKAIFKGSDTTTTTNTTTTNNQPA